MPDDDINEVEAVTLEASVVVAQLLDTLKGVCAMPPGKGLYGYLLSLSQLWFCLRAIRFISLC
jgi:hypothetical protein